MSAMNGGSGGGLMGGDSPFPHVSSGDLVPWPLLKAALLRNTSGDDLFPWPWLKGETVPHKDGGNHSSPPEGYVVGSGKAEFSALRLGSSVVISAKGTLQNLYQFADIRPGPWRVLPPQFQFCVYTRPMMWPAPRPFAFSEIFAYPPDEKSLVIHDADGPQTIEISEPKSTALAALLDERAVRGSDAQTATGLGASLQEAFDHAVAQLPTAPKHPDQLFTYTILESGLMRGGFAGFHHYYTKVGIRR